MTGDDQQHASYLPPGVAGTVVKKSDVEGNPTGFDPSAPTVVHIDPDEPDGGVVVDMSKVSREDMQKAMKDAESPHEAYYKLNSSTKKEGKEEIMKPLPAVTMPEVPDGSRTMAVPDQTAKIDQLTAGMAAMMAKLEGMEAKTEEVEPPVQLEEDSVESYDPIESLDMPFVTGDKPQKAKQVVYFDMGVLGNMMSRYHAVIEGQDCIVLVYDTRYEDGQQWIPPDRGEEPFHIQLENDKQKFLCSSLGLHFNIGVLDVTVLVKHSDSEGTSELEGDM